MNASINEVDLSWPPGVTRVPYRCFSDPAIYELEQRRLFQGPVWNYVALEAEIPTPGDFKATFVGDMPVAVSRDRDGTLHAFVNRCAHRGALLCREPCGNHSTHVCVYHQWSYNLRGDLIGVPFRKGINGEGGYPADFDLAEHSLRRLKVASYRGLVFVSFAEHLPSIEDYIGPQMRPGIDRVLSRPLRILGHARQFINGNWKLYAENVKDPYHASLLHLFHTTFGIYRSSQGGGTMTDDTGRHSHIRAYKRSEEEEVSPYEGQGLRTYSKGYSLADPSLLRTRREFDIEYTSSIQYLFPSLLVQQIFNTLAMRHIVPKAVDKFELIFTFFGYADDDPEMVEARLKQANLVGPAGLVSMEDGYVVELVQQAIVRDGAECSFVEMGGRETSPQENLLSEAALRAFWDFYRELMGFSRTN